MPVNVSVLVLNLLSIVTTAYGVLRCVQVVLPANLAAAGHKQFLTNIAAVVTICNGVLNVANQLAGGSSQTLQFWARELSLPVAMCLETVVCVIYWPLRLFFIHLIMHGVKSPDRAPLPLIIDMSVHLFPIMYLFTDYFLLKRTPFQIPGWKVFLVLPLLGLAYRVYLDTIIDPQSSYPYPFLDVAEPYKSVIFVTVSLSAGWIYTFYQKIHRRPAVAHKKRA